MPPIISIVGKSGSGKTTLIEKLIPELKSRGYRIGTVKHAFHKLDMDKKGKDSWRHKAAGADTVIVVSHDTIAMVKDRPLGSLDDLERYIDDLDLVITEGFKQKNKPKIEICRAARNTEPLCRDNSDLVALVTDMETNLNVPAFGLEDIKGLADLIEKKFLFDPITVVSNTPRSCCVPTAIDQPSGSPF
ncbi:MAG: molybdopterin-guanine dinucleotide biosynthesis protein B [Desulfobacterales bacterium]|nr:molybdopterin-guanine dinucleotide biosynthesis protein B [Desulfobacterales bacterium]